MFGVLVAWGAPAAAAVGVDPCGGTFGDVDGSGVANVVDVQCTIVATLWQLEGAPVAPPDCLAGGAAAADLSCEGTITVVDVVLAIGAVLTSGIDSAVDADGDGCPDACQQVACGDGLCGPGEDCIGCPADCACGGACVQLACQPAAAAANPRGCVVEALACDDGDPCTDDACAGASCAHVPALNVAGCPLQFFDFVVEPVTDTTAHVAFVTTQPATCAVLYGTAPDALDQTATAPMMAGQLMNDHAVDLVGLLPETTYYFRGQAVDATGTTYVSALHSFETLPPPEPGELVNYALPEWGTTVVAVSSNWAGGSDTSAWGAYKAIDGSMATEWATDGDGDAAFLELDLGQPRTLVSFGVRSRKMFDGSSIITKITLTFDDAVVLGPFDIPDPDVFYTFDLSPPVTAQRVRLDAVETTGGNTGLKELQLYGYGPP